MLYTKITETYRFIEGLPCLFFCQFGHKESLIVPDDFMVLNDDCLHQWPTQRKEKWQIFKAPEPIVDFLIQCSSDKTPLVDFVCPLCLNKCLAFTW